MRRSVIGVAPWQRPSANDSASTTPLRLGSAAKVPTSASARSNASVPRFAAFDCAQRKWFLAAVDCRAALEVDRASQQQRYRRGVPPAAWCRDGLGPMIAPELVRSRTIASGLPTSAAGGARKLIGTVPSLWNLPTARSSKHDRFNGKG